MLESSVGYNHFWSFTEIYKLLSSFVSSSKSIRTNGIALFSSNNSILISYYNDVIFCLFIIHGIVLFSTNNSISISYYNDVIFSLFIIHKLSYHIHYLPLAQKCWCRHIYSYNYNINQVILKFHQYKPVIDIDNLHKTVLDYFIKVPLQLLFHSLFHQSILFSIFSFQNLQLLSILFPSGQVCSIYSFPIFCLMLTIFSFLSIVRTFQLPILNCLKDFDEWWIERPCSLSYQAWHLDLRSRYCQDHLFFSVTLLHGFLRMILK